MLKSRSKLPKHRALILEKVSNYAGRFGIKIYGSAVAFDHLHLVLTILDRRGYVAFLRALCGVLARKLGAKLWALPPFTRVASWGRDFRQLLNYLKQNREETAGLRPYKTRNDGYRRFRN